MNSAIDSDSRQLSVVERDDVSLPAAVAGAARAILTPLASLKLTVGLLVASVFVTWIATLQQTRMDIWDVKRAHFPALVTPVDFEVLFPPAWFPEMNRLKEAAPEGDVAAKAIPGRFFVPSGFTLIVAMLVNLLAAHLLRMRIQASGSRLGLGAVVMLAGGVATWFVIFAGQNPDGFQVNYETGFYYALWIGVQLLMLVLAQIVAVVAWRLPMGRTAARVVGWFGAAALFGAAVAMLYSGEKAFIGDSAMRILWQLIQGSVVAAITLAGCMLVFRRKGGIVLLHIGITMLLANEIWVTLTNVEQRMQLFEGQQAAQTVDIRTAELFVADLSDPTACTVIQAPGSLLARREAIRDEALPFDIVCLEWHANADLTRLPADAARQVTEGYGRDFEIRPLKLATGTGEQDEYNLAAARIQLIDRKSGQPMGIWLVSQLAEENGLRDTVTVDGKAWQIGLRFTHYYKPYTISLVDTRSQNYVGTQTARTYESTIELTDSRQALVGARREVKMNNPLRYGNETFYQSGYRKLPDGREYTVLQIVQNKGWMIPYVACMYVVIGLVGHFAGMLAGFLAKVSSRSAEPGQTGGETLVEATPLDQPSTTDLVLARVVWAIPVGLGLLIVGGTLASSLRAPVTSVAGQEMPLDAFARIPVTFNGRVQPLESLARNTARMLSHRETVLRGDNKTKVPALRWMADTVFAAEGHEDYLIFRIEDLGVLSELGLEPRKGLRYSLAEVEQARARIDRMLEAAEPLPAEQWSNTQKRMKRLSGQIGQLYALKAALGDPDLFTGEFLQQTDAVNRIARSPEVPLVVPTGDKSAPWISLAAAHRMETFAGLAQAAGTDDLNAISDRLTERELVGPVRANLLRDRMIEAVLADDELLRLFRSATGLTDKEVLRQKLSDSFATFPADVKASLLPLVQPAVDAAIEARRPEWQSTVRELVRGVYGQLSPAVRTGFEANYRSLLGLGAAWRERDPEKFDQLAQAHLATVRSGPVTPALQRGMSAETVLDRSAPFYLATMCYLLAALTCVASWMGQRAALGSAASILVWLAIAAHGLGILLRMEVTGRPPVTNLYGSFLFVSFAAAVFLQVLERWTRVGACTLLGSLFGALVLLWAWSVSINDGDTMAVLVAVLDTQFWLSTHVICISLGYVATIVAGLLGLMWTVWSLADAGMNAQLSRRFLQLVYGTTAFALLLSFFGTVLGGLWGDDSWGRFWGWDPKENGALMIVLWNAVLLHARWAGIVRDRGIAALATFGIVVTIWSWECVNQLGVGLHSYGVSASRLMIVLQVMGGLSLVSLAGLLPRRMWNSPAVRRSL